MTDILVAINKIVDKIDSERHELDFDKRVAETPIAAYSADISKANANAAGISKSSAETSIKPAEPSVIDTIAIANSSVESAIKPTESSGITIADINKSLQCIKSFAKSTGSGNTDTIEINTSDLQAVLAAMLGQ